MDVAAGHGPEISGRRLIFRLFLVLWLATLTILVGFGVWTVERFDVATSRRVWVALVVNLMLPAIAWQVFRLIHARRDQADGAP